jgi:hypothetical protein
VATQIKVDLPNLSEGDDVEVDGLGLFTNGETAEVDDAVVQTYEAQRGHLPYSGYGVTVTIDGNESTAPEEDLPVQDSRLGGSVTPVVSVDDMDRAQLLAEAKARGFQEPSDDVSDDAIRNALKGANQ